MMTGQAAGTAAALATDGDFTKVDTDLLRKTLFADGILDPDELPFD